MLSVPKSQRSKYQRQAEAIEYAIAEMRQQDTEEAAEKERTRAEYERAQRMKDNKDRFKRVLELKRNAKIEEEAAQLLKQVRGTLTPIISYHRDQVGLVRLGLGFTPTISYHIISCHRKPHTKL